MTANDTPTPEQLTAKWRKRIKSPEAGIGVVGETYMVMLADELEASLAALGPVVAVSDLQEALKRCLGEDHGIHDYTPNLSGKVSTQRCRKCDHAESFILHMKSMTELVGQALAAWAAGEGDDA